MAKWVFASVILLLAFMCCIKATLSANLWAWRCTGPSDDTAECIRVRADQSTDQMTLNKCKLVCGKYGSLVPRPYSVTMDKSTTPFLPSKISLNADNCEPNVCHLLNEAFDIMVQTLNKYHPKYAEGTTYWLGPWESNVENHVLNINFNVTSAEEYLTLTTDESYHLLITTQGSETLVNITANSFFGARHALETLSQLIDFDEDNNSLQVVSSATIEDFPVFPYRGIILDTSRNFINIRKIRKTLDAMSYNKLNTFHWHISDTHSFPLNLNSLPNMATYGAYSPFQVYSPSDIRDIVQYARIRGIRVLPEIDAPAHVGHGWQWGEEKGLGKLVVCLDKKPWTLYCVEAPCGQMNIANPKLYGVLGTLYKEVADMFSPLDLFHYGGDEVNLNCWNTSSEVTDWMVQNGFGLDENAYLKQWSIFQEKARLLLTIANGNTEVPGIIWTSKLTEIGHVDHYLDKNKYIIQIWTTGKDPLIKELLEKGYRVIFSNYDALYFDCGVSSWVGKGTNWCSPYKGWQDVYDNDIHAIAKNLTGSTQYNDQILGGEAALWTEQADDSTVEAKLWPRGSALAERLWSNPLSDYVSAEYRILQHRHRLVTRGIEAERLQPEWCRQNQGQCRYITP